MKNLIGKIQASFGIESARTKNITKHVILSFIYKGGHILANLLLVPITIKFLDTENYGVWLTLSSFIVWFTFFDIGLGNGLRNKFAEAKAKGDIELARGYVSTAYVSIGVICLVFLCLSFGISYLTDWTKIFNTSEILKNQLQVLMPIVFGCFGLQLILKLISSIYTADQDHSMQGKISFINATGSLLLIWLLTLTSRSSLLLYGIIISFLPVLILTILTAIAFIGPYRKYIPRISNLDKKYFHDIFGLGLTFFLIQISVIVLYSTDNFIITQLFGPEEVVPYNIAYKYIGISSMVLTIVLTPYWSSITEAFAKNDVEWIKKSMTNLVKLSLLALILIVIMVLLAPYAYRLWIGDMVAIPFTITLCMAIYFGIAVLYAPFNYFINGTGKLRLHMYSFIIGAIINIPLSIFLVKYVHLGTEGVIIATSICVLPNLVLFPLQYSKLINKTAVGIWNK